MDDPERPPEASLLVRAARRHPNVVDALVVLAVCFASLPPIFIQRGGGAAAVLWSAGLIAPLVVRRRFPLGAYGAIACVALLQWFIAGDPLLADMALLVCFATIAANRPARVTRIAAAVLEAGVALAVTRWFRDTWLPSLVFLSGMVAAAGFMGTNLRTRRAYLAHLEDRARRLERERDQQIQLAEAGERARIARELHDVVAHHLTVVITLADAAGRLPDSAAERGRELMATVSATGRTALTEMRRLLGVLREERALGSPVGLVPPVEREAAAIRAPQPDLDRLDDLVAQVRTAGLPVALTVSGDRSPLPPGVELALYRAVQEALTNVLRHAAPGSRATVTLQYGVGEVRIRVVDRPGGGPGSGAAPERGLAGPGNGLTGMRERIAACGGTVTAGPRTDGGWEIRIEVPVPVRIPVPVPSAPSGSASGSAAFVGVSRPSP